VGVTFENFPPFEKSSDTSFAAARSMKDVTGELRRAVARFIVERGRYGATDDEVEVDLGMRHQTASARRWELAQKDFIKKSGEKRLTRSGRKAAVWVWHSVDLDD